MILDYLIIWKKLDLVKSTKSPTITLKVFLQPQNESFILKYTYQTKIHKENKTQKPLIPKLGKI